MMEKEPLLPGEAFPTYSDPARPVEITVGKKFIIELKSNPTTGFSWVLARRPDREVAQLIKSEYFPPESGVPGGGGKEIWTFEATGPGKSTMALVYLRTWRKNASPLLRKIFVIISRRQQTL